MSLVKYSNQDNGGWPLTNSVGLINLSNSQITLKPNLVGALGHINPEIMPWTNTEIVQPKKGTKRLLKAGYEIFYEYALSINDPYWKEIFITASTGKMPKGCFFRNNQIIFEYRKKQEVINVYSGPDEIIKFFGKNIRLKSTSDRKVDDENHLLYMDNLNKSTNKYEKWSMIRNNHTKRLMVLDFCKKKEEEWHLTKIETNQLQTLINIHLSTGFIKDNNILVMNQTIVEINNLTWDASTRSFNLISNEIETSLNIDNSSKTLEYKASKKQNESLDVQWAKYLKNFIKSKKSLDQSFLTPKLSNSMTPMIQSP